MAETDKPKDTPEAESGLDTVNSGDIVDAVIIEDAPVLEDPTDVSTDDDVSSDGVTDSDETISDSEPDESDEPVATDELVDDVLAGDDDIEPAEEAPQAVVPPVIHEKVVERKGGFVPMILGGAVAAGLGFGAAQYTAGTSTFEADVTKQLSGQSEQLGVLDGRLGATETAIGDIDLTPVQTALDEQTAGLGTLQTSLADVSASLASLEERISTMEKRPVVDAVSPEAIAAYERELDRLREDVTRQRAEIQEMANTAVAAQQDATRQAQLAKARTALADLIAAVDSGAPYAASLNVLTQSAGITAPAALAAAAENGLPAQGALISGFPDQARAALATARATAPAEETSGGVGAFFKSQLGVRSLTPREGDDPDAVLSRAEAAVRNGDIQTALTELQALPPAAQEEISDWVSQATTRHEALAALDTLSAELNEE